jgi:hypothetical protein
MTQDHGKMLTLRNGIPYSGWAWKFTFDQDSLYQSDSILNLETRNNSWAYRFNTRKDSLYLGEIAVEEHDNVWVRNSDSLPEIGSLADPY